MLPRLGIVTPSFNAEAHIGDTVRSVLAQQGADFDYLVMDGDSTDGTVDVLQSFGERLRWISEKDAGQSDAINRGFARVEGEVLGWINADDVYEPGAFRAVAEHFAAHPELAMVYGDCRYIDAAGRPIAPCAHVEPWDPHRLRYYSDFIAQPSAFFRREAFEAVGGLDVSLNWTMDWDLWLRLADRGYKVAYVPKLLASYRWLTHNKTAVGGHPRIDEIQRTLARHGYPMPAYAVLERCNLYANEAMTALRAFRPMDMMIALTKGTRDLLRSPRAIASVFSPHTWNIIRTGRILRTRAVASARLNQSAIRNPQSAILQT